MFAALLPILGNLLAPVIQSFFPNPEDKLKAQELQNQLTLAIIQNGAAIEKAASDNIRAEIGEGNWLTKSWRPILMLVFGGLIVARWLGYSAPGISESEALELWSIVKIGIGGYVVGRSVEKTAPQVLAALKSKQD